MGTIATQQIIYEPRQSRVAPSSGPTQDEVQGEAQVRGERTTGLFEVPTGVGNPITVSIFLSNPTTQSDGAEVRVRRLTNGGLSTVFFRRLGVPAGQVRVVDLGDMAGQTIEVSVSPPSTALVPSVSVTEFFPADGGIIVRLAKHPGDFVEV